MAFIGWQWWKTAFLLRRDIESVKHMDQHGEFQLAKWNYSETMAFPMLGDHVIGMILLLSSQQRSYIITTTDYFIKWVEVIPLREVDQKSVASFVKEFIIHWSLNL